MTMWLILTVMTSAAAVLVSVPIIRRFEQPQTDSSSDIEVYRHQLKEVANEATQGLIDATHAETARAEIKQRLLSADRIARSGLPALSHGERNFAVICVVGMVVLGAVGLYALTGSPDLPSAPGVAATRTTESIPDPSAVEKLAALERPQAPETPAQMQPRANLPPIDEMIRRLVARLQRNPKDAEGWRTLGWSYFNTDHFAEAADAYAKAIELTPNIVEIRGARAEALVRAANGIVTPEAKSAVEDILKLDPKDARGRFFKGLAKEQAGDKAMALVDWIGLLKDADPNEPWVPDLKKRIGMLGKEIGDEATTSPTRPNPAVAGGVLEALRTQERSQASPAIEKVPTPADVQKAEIMPPADRLAMIRGMVDGLAKRLEQSPRDADGWIKLIRSRMVLGETELAKQALESGLKAFSEDSSAGSACRGRAAA
jgi:cytochrome c-type biogenesis protein CcmH